MKTAVFSAHPYDRTSLDAANAAGLHELHYIEATLTAETRRVAYGYPGLCVFVNDKLDRETLMDLAAHGLRVIALRCAGFNNVDLTTARELGIPVLRVPAYSPHAVAEHAVALILTLNRKTHKAYNRVREGNFSLERLEGFDLYGKTVGVIGAGRIGQVFRQIMLGFGCQVLVYDRYPSAELAGAGVVFSDLNTVLAASDILSLHCPLTPETRHLIDASAITRMKDGVMLINTSRGALVDTQAVIEGLKNGKIAYLGIDVYEQEESLFFRDLSETVIQDDELLRLMTFPNVLVTAHQAFFTHNALNQIAQTTLGNLTAFEQGAPLPHAVG
ncbi:MAG: 2-hydroxyacid dehydrogenase [Bacteroidia bacterium]|nr:2-hydroxyacid dehydrogenase [Bacteroidia bacterium]